MSLVFSESAVSSAGLANLAPDQLLVGVERAEADLSRKTHTGIDAVAVTRPV